MQYIFIVEPLHSPQTRTVQIAGSCPVEGLCCKRPIQCLASSEILTPPPLTNPASVYPPPLVRGEDTLSGWRGGGGLNIPEDARHCSVLYICKYFVVHPLTGKEMCGK
jgi:hypothetical protein